MFQSQSILMSFWLTNQLNWPAIMSNLELRKFGKSTGLSAIKDFPQRYARGTLDEAGCFRNYWRIQTREIRWFWNSSRILLLSAHSVLERIWIRGSYLSQWLPQDERDPLRSQNHDELKSSMVGPNNKNFFKVFFRLKKFFFRNKKNFSK